MWYSGLTNSMTDIGHVTNLDMLFVFIAYYRSILFIVFMLIGSKSRTEMFVFCKQNVQHALAVVLKG